MLDILWKCRRSDSVKIQPLKLSFTVIAVLLGRNVREPTEANAWIHKCCGIFLQSRTCKDSRYKCFKGTAVQICPLPGNSFLTLSNGVIGRRCSRRSPWQVRDATIEELLVYLSRYLCWWHLNLWDRLSRGLHFQKDAARTQYFWEVVWALEHINENKILAIYFSLPLRPPRLSWHWTDGMVQNISVQSSKRVLHRDCT